MDLRGSSTKTQGYGMKGFIPTSDARESPLYMGRLFLGGLCCCITEAVSSDSPAKRRPAAAFCNARVFLRHPLVWLRNCENSPRKTAGLAQRGCGVHFTSL